MAVLVVLVVTEMRDLGGRALRDERTDCTCVALGTKGGGTACEGMGGCWCCCACVLCLLMFLALQKGAVQSVCAHALERVELTNASAHAHTMATPSIPSLSSSLVEVRACGADVGGGRGVFALQDLQPGQLLLVEQPMLTMPDALQPGVRQGSCRAAADSHARSRGARRSSTQPCTQKQHPCVAPVRAQETLHRALARAVVQHADPQPLLHAMAHLHPASLDSLPPTVLQAVQAQHAADVDALVACASPAAAALGSDAVLRVLLVMRFNAHPSGLYRLSEMFNHACCPNAIKLFVNGASEMRAVRCVGGRRRGAKCSPARRTGLKVCSLAPSRRRPIARGEQVTFS